MANAGEGGALAWKDVAEVSLASAGVIGVTFVAISWIRWWAYLSYFDVPIGAVNLGIRDLVAHSWYWIAIVGAMAASTMGALTLRARASTGHDKTPSVKLAAMLPFIIPIVLLACILSVFFPLALRAEGLQSALVRTSLVGWFELLGIVSGVVFFRLAERAATSWKLIALITLVAVLIGSAWPVGYLGAYARWHADHREDRFKTVVLYSEMELFEGWQRQGDVFASPELMLITRAGNTYVVIDNERPDRATVISSDVVTHVDYMR
jgi:hypothetical protein